MMISQKKIKFPSAVCGENSDSNSIICLFYRCWLYKRCSGIRSKVKEDSKFKYQAWTNQQTDNKI